MSMLKVEGLNVYYGSIHAIKGVSFEVNQGEIVTMIGANGAGKSTTMNTVAGLLKPKSGSITFEGHDVTTTPANKVVSLGLALCPEGRRVFQQMSVRENLEMGGYTRPAGELAASLETLLACPGGEFGADQLETLMYNTIDAAFSPDGRGVQPMQQANQAMLSRAARFPLCGEDAGLFSLEDGDALCSLLSAWPRFVQAQWMISRDDGLCAMGYAPCSVRYRLSGASVRVDVESDYPASGSVHITVHTDTKAAFPIHLRIPEWANGATVAVDGEILPAQAGGFVTLNRDWQDSDEILLTLPMAVRRLPAFHQAVSVARGPLRFAYAPKTVEHEDTLSAEIGFAVALVGGEEIRVVEHMDGSVVLAARVAPLPRWGMRAASCDQPPIVLSDADVAKAFDAELVPYAEAIIRLAVLPVL